MLIARDTDCARPGLKEMMLAETLFIETLLEETLPTEMLAVETLRAKNRKEHAAQFSLRQTRLDEDASKPGLMQTDICIRCTIVKFFQ